MLIPSSVNVLPQLPAQLLEPTSLPEPAAKLPELPTEIKSMIVEHIPYRSPTLLRLTLASHAWEGVAFQKLLASRLIDQSLKIRNHKPAAQRLSKFSDILIGLTQSAS
jgi:hypothetical protein